MRDAGLIPRDGEPWLRDLHPPTIDEGVHQYENLLRKWTRDMRDLVNRAESLLANPPRRVVSDDPAVAVEHDRTLNEQKPDIRQVRLLIQIISSFEILKKPIQARSGQYRDFLGIAHSEVCFRLGLKEPGKRHRVPMDATVFSAWWIVHAAPSTWPSPQPAAPHHVRFQALLNHVKRSVRAELACLPGFTQRD
jgi:hypothetical protein